MSGLTVSAEPVRGLSDPHNQEVQDASGEAADCHVTEPNQVISFAIGDEQYGVDIVAVREIRGWSEVTQLPGQPDYVRGVLNLRGAVVAVIDLRCRLGQGRTEATPLHIAIIVQMAARQIGLLADRVLDIISFEASQMQPVPRIGDGSDAGFLAGLVTTGDVMIALIDLPNLLAVEIDDQDGAQTISAFASTKVRQIDVGELS